MSANRMSIEWQLFLKSGNYFKFLDFKKNLKLSLGAVGKIYIVCAILRNALTCMYTNSTSEYFALDPPTIIFLEHLHLFICKTKTFSKCLFLICRNKTLTTRSI